MGLAGSGLGIAYLRILHEGPAPRYTGCCEVGGMLADRLLSKATD